MLYLSSLFEVSRQYIPHGHCYLWQPELVWLHVIGDTLTAVAYYSIPLMLLYFVRKRQDVPFQGIFLLFSAFILACGTTHIVEVWTLWQPTYWFSGTIKLITASVSLYTAYALVGLIPQALALPSPAQLEAANAALKQEIQEREQVEMTLRESEHRFRTLLQELRIGVVVQDLKSDILISNPAAQQLLGFSEEQLNGKNSHDPEWDVIREDGSAMRGEDHPVPQVIATGQPVRNVVMGVLRSHFSSSSSSQSLSSLSQAQPDTVSEECDRVWLLVDAEPQFDTNHQLQQVICSFLDITERRQIEEERRQYTQQLQKALASEALLKRITEKIRDSLDEHQIVQTAVEELVQLLEIEYCEARFFEPESHLRICNQGSEQLCLSQCDVVDRMQRSGLDMQIQRGEALQFCEQTNCQIFNRVTVLILPIVDNQHTLGALWLFKPAGLSFDASEISLIQQVANQCAIAIRQARLYQAVQAQVEELERLNRLKDDFLSTVSHELRTPMSNMNMALHLLDKAPSSRRATYLSILRTECDREIELINSLLDLQRLEAEAFDLAIEPIDLMEWLPTLLQPFHSRCQQQQQQLQVEPIADLPVLMSDVASLKRILAELLNNACKYTPPDGIIHFHVQQLAAAPALLASGAVADSSVVDQPVIVGMGSAICTHNPVTSSTLHLPIKSACNIADTPISAIETGHRTPTVALPASNRTSRRLTPPPEVNTVQFVISNQAAISPKELPHIFDKFYRVPNADPWKRGGTGLGLALVKKLVEHLNGSINVTSDAGWTRFTLNLPHYP